MSFSMLARRGAWVVASLLCLGSAQAGLLDDDEARKAILDLRARVQSTEETNSKRLAELTQANAQLLEQVQQLRRSLLDLNTQLETQRAEMANLRGGQEQVARDVTELQRRQKDTVQGVEDRLRKLEPQPVVVDGKEILADPEERRANEEAMAALRSGDFARASTLLAAFIRRWPTSGYTPSARFWLGNALYGKRDYKEAIAIFRAMVIDMPEHPRAPEALLSVANCQIEMKDNKAGRRTLEDLIKTYPKSEAAVAAKERLGSLKG